MKLLTALLLSTLAASSTARPRQRKAEGEEHSCACEALEFNFDIDCANTSAMLDAMTVLKTSGCAQDCSSELCERNYLIVQSHHDYCPEAGIPEEVEDGFHDYDETCNACHIVRIAEDDAPDCPEPNCENTSGNDAYAALIEGGCLSECSEACKENWFTLRVVHDLCDHDVLSRAAEEGLHDLEESCVQHVCNVPGGKDSQLVCDEHDDHDHDHEDVDEKSGAAAATAAATAAVVGLAAFMA